jgi:2-polyprenyl-3-methyl-5-hydroxy-6-metoxy-1,4-benzoquinol methylase
MRIVQPTLNKLADFDDLHGITRRAVIERLVKIRAFLNSTGMPYATDMDGHWLRMWEYSWAICSTGCDCRMRVLDAGGTGTILSYLLAAEAYEVHTVDILEQKIREARALTDHLALDMHHHHGSILDLPMEDGFFHTVFCICVIEHILPDDQPKAVRELARVLAPGGMLAMTYDFGAHTGAEYPLLSTGQVTERIIEPSGLEVVGNEPLDMEQIDPADGWQKCTFGSILLRKPGELRLQAVGRLMFQDFPALRRVWPAPDGSTRRMITIGRPDE